MQKVNEADGRPSGLPRGILCLWMAFLLVSTILAISCALYKHLGYGPPYSYPFPDDLLGDLTVYLQTFRSFHTENFFRLSTQSRFAYPPGAAVIYKILYSFHRLKVVYAILVLGWAVFLIGTFTHALSCHRIKLAISFSFSATFCLSFPFLFLVQRGNIEIALWILISFGIFGYLHERPYISAILWGAAAAIKIYPIFLLGTFLGRRRPIGPFLVGFSSAFLTTLLSLWYVGPSVKFAFYGFLGGVQGFQSSYAERVRLTELGFDHSFFSLVKLTSLALGRAPGTWLHPYYVIAGAVTALVFLLRVIHLPFANRLLFVTVALVLLPPVSYEYTLVHLYIPAALITLFAIETSTPLKCDSRSEPSYIPMVWALACFAVLFLPANVFIFHGRLYAGQAKVIPLLFLGGLAAIYPFTGESVHSMDLAKVRQRVPKHF